MESFRARNVGALGAKRGVTPHFDPLSKEGILFTDLVGPLKKRRLKKKLEDVKAGKLRGDYKMKYVK